MTNWWSPTRWFGVRGGAAPVREEQGRDDDLGWRAVVSGRGASGTEFDLADWQGLLREAYLAYSTNPLAYAVIEQGTNFVLGGGAHVVAKDARVQRVVDRFWGDPENRMDERIYSILSELSLFGEQFVRFFVEEGTGRVVIRQLDPLHVTGIETDPEDVERVLRYRYAPPGTVGAVAGGDAVGELLGERLIEAAEVAHFAINRVSGALRGRSDLAPLLPWLRRYRQWLEDRVRQNKYKGAFLYDVTVQGAHKADLDRLRAEYAAAPPEPGSVLFHNEAEEWKAVQPHVGAGDVRDDGRALRLMIAVGAGIPKHYLSEGGIANRATAKEMGLPAIKRFQRRQEYFRQVLERICGRVVEEAVRAGVLGPRVSRELAVQFEELSPNPAGELAGVAEQMARALESARRNEWVTDAEARTLWWRLVGEATDDRLS